MLHTLHGHFLAEIPTDNDKWHVKPALLHVPQGTECVELRQVVIGENDVQGLVQVGEILRFGLHALPDGGKPRPAQFVQHQLGISRLVFKNQHAQGRRHPVPCTPSARKDWRLVEKNPVHAKRAHRCGELLEIDWLGNVTIDAQAVALDDITLLAR